MMESQVENSENPDPKKKSKAYLIFIGLVGGFGVIGLGLFAAKIGPDWLKAIGFFFVGVGLVFMVLSMTLGIAGITESEGWLMVVFGFYLLLALMYIFIFGAFVHPTVMSFLGGGFGATLFFIPIWRRRRKIRKEVRYNGKLLLIRSSLKDIEFPVESLRVIIARMRQEKLVSLILRYGQKPWQRSEVMFKNTKKFLDILTNDHPGLKNRIVERSVK